tara:strand:+ start:2360 stop:2533 length:174 start_codon:yes stop_codon:yes gene_type:complete
MAQVLTQTYCYFCEAVAETFTKCMGITESIGKARAASALAQMGYYKEAKSLMLEETK